MILSPWTRGRYKSKPCNILATGLFAEVFQKGLESLWFIDFNPLQVGFQAGKLASGNGISLHCCRDTNVLK